MPLRVAIVGAGPAGCLLARLLQQSDKEISVTLFESEGSINFRSQGGTLDLHEKTGQAALARAGLYDEFLKHARYDGEAMKLADKKLLCYISMNGSKQNSSKGSGRPEIDRPKLRELLYHGLKKDSVQWNKKLLRVDKDLTLYFADGTSQGRFDLLVGADGAWSKVRQLLSDAKPYYSGIAGHSFLISDAAQTVPELHKLVNRGSLFSFSDQKSIMAQQMGDGNLNIATWSIWPSDWQTNSGFDVHDATAVKAAYRRRYADWDPRLVAFIEQADDDSFTTRDLFMLPIGHSWKHISGVTLVGDAAHLMTPFAGEGVNLAFEDSMKLADAVISAATSGSADSLDVNIADFEADMFKRATETQQLTWDMLAAMFLTPGAPRASIERYIIRAMEGELGPLLTMVAKPVVYMWFFIFKLFW